MDRFGEHYGSEREALPRYGVSWLGWDAMSDSYAYAYGEA